jgi:hypothetical protein
VNIEDMPIETVFLFPKTDKTALSKITCEFTLPNGSKKTIETKVQDRETA